MGRRHEPRIAISYPVLVRGFDSRGTPFAVRAETYDVSTSGASLKGLNGLVEIGKNIEIEFGDQKAWYRVQWVGGSSSAKAGKVGVHCLERKYIWDVPAKPPEPDTFDETSAAPRMEGAVAASAWNGTERRLFRRSGCRIEAQVSIPGSTVQLPGRVTDISLGGCYVEMLAPLPIDTMVELTLSTDEITLRASGKVRASQAGLGMGVAFACMGSSDFEKLRKLAPPATGSAAVLKPPATAAPQPPAQRQVASAETSHRLPPAAQPPPNHLPTTAEALEAVVRVLLRKGLLARDELAAELDKMKAVKR
ncbi:MAG TPA: PilZ domain-containing protein [Candidatus Limnocylindrales bacterium]|nr:PilZ domain-containing protein [Candidatus Limnocylindrales bacterium]